MIRVFLVDDDAESIVKFEQACSEIEGIELVGTSPNWVSSVDACDRLSPELIVVNWRLPGQTVAQMVDYINNEDVPPALCVSSPHQSDAWEAFRAGARGFLVKPYRSAPLQSLLESLLRPNRIREVVGADQGRREFITIKSRRGLSVVPIDEIRYFYADQKYVMAVTPECERVLDEPLRKLEHRYGDLMLRVHRNAIVSLRHVCGLKRLSSGQYRVELSDLEEGPIVSRRHLAQVRARLASM